MISVKELFEGFTDPTITRNSSVIIAYNCYDSECDEDLDYVDVVGIDRNNNIYFARTYKDLTSLEQNGIYMKKCISRLGGFHSIMTDILYLIRNYSECEGNIFIKNYTGYVLPIKRILHDEKKDRVIFIV